jgi:hypothetical protein
MHGNMNYDMIWPLQLNARQLPLQIHPPLHDVNLFPPAATYPTIPVVGSARVDNSPVQNNLSQPRQMQPSDDSTTLPKLTMAKLKSSIKPVYRHLNHEIDLPKELEPYFGKGWTCRYYHSTPAWGFIPPKGSGMRRADGFKALMSRLELLDFRKKTSQEATLTQRITSSHTAFVQSMPRQNMLSALHNGKGSDVIERKRVSEVSSPTIHIDHQGITIKKARLLSQEDATEEQQPKVASFTRIASGHDIFKVNSPASTYSQDLPHEVTFETKSSQDEGSVGPPKKRFLSRNHRDFKSGIGLLAHAASLLQN